LFHLLISEATEQMLHTGASARQFRHVLGRAFSHESMVKACKSFHGGTLPAVVTETAGSVTVPPDLQTVAGIFVELQEMRHPADYDLGRQFSRGDVLTLLDKLDDAFEAWRRVRIVPIARFFLALLPLWDKVARR
jgi:hypothetical protein